VVGGVRSAAGLLDLSEGGALCVFPAELRVAVRAVVQLVLTLDGREQLITAAVVRERSSEEGREVALAFQDLEADAERLIRDYLTEILGAEV
jgi:c-di-GMP-binding flagellar brake protein YcgR